MKGREKKAENKREDEDEAATNNLEEVNEDSQKMQQEDNTRMVFAKRSVLPRKAEDENTKEDSAPSLDVF